MNDFALRALSAPLGKTHIFSVGQAGYIIKSSSGKLLGIDLYLSECVERLEGHVGFKRLLPRILMPFDIQFDVLVATHPHLDHFDIDSIPELMSNSNTKLFASVDCEKLVDRLMMKKERVAYVKPGDSFKEDGFELDFIKSDHGSGAPDAVGVIVSVDGKRICEAGDTCLRLDWKNEYLKKGPLDVLIAPINGAYGNLTENDCALLSDSVKPKLTIPCHYGMFASHGGNPGLFYEIMTKQYSQNDFLLMAQGERYTFND